MHSVDSIDDAACDWYGNQPIPVSGEGAPLVAEFSIAEFAVALGLSTETGKAYIGEALELRHRLPRTWARVVAGDLQAWRARRIAQRTIALSREAAAYVDKVTAPVRPQDPARRARADHHHRDRPLHARRGRGPASRPPRTGAGSRSTPATTSSTG